MYLHPQDVRDFLGPQSQDVPDHAIEPYLSTATAMVRAYTRNQGFDPVTGNPADDLAAVIVSSAARLHNNPTLTKQVTTGPYAVSQGTFEGWTLAELAVLNGYRKRAW